MPLQVKESGSPVDFANSRSIDMQKITFPDDIFGIYAYQSIPLTVDVSVRDAFVNGNLNDLQTQATGQGMPVQYVRISWNETLQNGRYYITDLVVGAVVRVTRNFNTGPAYLVDAFKTVGWFNQLISKLSMPWVAWLLMVMTRSEPYNSWCWEAKSALWLNGSPVGQPIPDLPSTDEVKSHLMANGNIDNAIGEFVRQMLDKGYTVTMLGYRVDVAFKRGADMPLPNYMHGYAGTTFTRLTWDFITNPDFTSAAQAGSLFVITATIIFELILLIGALIIAGMGVYVFLNNLTTTTKTYVKWGWVQNPATGEWQWVPVEQGSTTAPPDWWSYVVPIVALIGAGIAGYAIYQVIPRRKK